MKIISLKDYAKHNNISYEAVRKQVARYKKDLEGHIIKDNRTQFLDEEAVAFLDARREKSPVVIIQQDKDDRIKGLEEENKTLLQRVAMLQDDLLKSKELQIQLQAETAEQRLLAERTTAAEERAAVAEHKAAEAERLAISIRQKNVEIETALTSAEEENKTLSDIAEINAQEADKAKAEAEELRAELERLKNRGFWARLFNK